MCAKSHLELKMQISIRLTDKELQEVRKQAKELYNMSSDLRNIKYKVVGTKVSGVRTVTADDLAMAATRLAVKCNHVLNYIEELKQERLELIHLLFPQTEESL